MVTHSRMVVLSPISAVESSPLNFKSCGTAEITEPINIYQFFPIRPPSIILSFYPILFPSPISTFLSMVLKGSMTTFLAITALG